MTESALEWALLFYDNRPFFFPPFVGLIAMKSGDSSTPLGITFWH